jgi:hypothetical protein
MEIGLSMYIFGHELFSLFAVAKLELCAGLA